MMNYEDISSFCRGLATLVHAGIGAADCLYLMAEDAPDEKQRDLFRAMAQNVDTGMPQSEAVRLSNVFPSNVPAMMEVGERTGHTEETLKSLSDDYDGRCRLDSQLRSALLYPSILLLVMLAVLVVLLTYVLPVFSDVYARLGSELTGVAGTLLSVGGWLHGVMPVLLAVVGVLSVFFLLFALSERFRTMIFGFINAKFGEHGVFRRQSSAAFVRALSMGFSSGLQTEACVRLAAELMDTPGARSRAEKCEMLVLSGKGLPQALNETGFVSASESRLLSVAMRGGAGDSALERMANDLTYRAEEAIQSTISRVEPTMVIAGAVLVGLILMSVMMPMLNIMSAIG